MSDPSQPQTEVKKPLPNIVLAPQKKKPVEISLRPQTGAKKTATTSTSPAKTNSADERPNVFDVSNDGPVDEVPLDKSKRIYTRAFMNERKPPQSVVPDLETVTSLKSCGIWTDTVSQTFSTPFGIPPSTSSSNAFSQPRDNRKSGPSGAGAKGPGGANKPGTGGQNNRGPRTNQKGPKDAKRPVMQKDQLAAFFGSIQSLLNKLTLEKFDALTEKLITCIKQIDTAEVLESVVKLVHKKALSEPHFSSLYSDLCKRLEEESPQFPDPTGKKPLAFLKIMLNQLQTVFLEKIPHLTDEEALLKARSRALGNIVFIGEMFKHKLVHPTIVQRCIDELVSYINKALPNVASDKDLALDTENNCEKLVKMVSVVGKELEKYPALRPGTPSFKELMNKNFEHFKDYASNNHLQPRVRFLIRDLIDMKLNDWTPRRQVEGPKKIETIHAEAELEQDGLLPVSSGAALKVVPSSVYEQRAKEKAEALANATAEDDAINDLVHAYVDDAESSTVDIANMLKKATSPQKVNFVNLTVNLGIDFSVKSQQKVATLLVALAKQNSVSSSDLKKGLEGIFASLEDLIVDAPTSPSSLGYFLAQLVVNSIFSEDVAQTTVNACSKEDHRTKVLQSVHKQLTELRGK